MTDKKTPIIYSNKLPTRFSDLDAYGHVGAPKYLDYIIASRWNYVETQLNTNAQELISKGLGFYLAASTIVYKKSVAGCVELDISSWISNCEGPKLDVEFTIELDGTRMTDGVLNFVIMDLRAMKPQRMPEWAEGYFWEE